MGEFRQKGIISPVFRHLTALFSLITGKGSVVRRRLHSPPALGGSIKQAVAIVGLAALVSACSDPCANTVVSKVDSPDGLHSAILFQRDCGATTGFSTQISIVAKGETPTWSGNTFRADDDQGAARVGDWGGSWASVTWLANDRLLVRYAQKSRIFEQAANADGVQVTYKVD